jgi:hypothetical protein
MFKMSVLSKVTTFAIIIALVLASLPMTSVFAGSPEKEKLEAKWDELNQMFKTQKSSHNLVERMHKNWHANVEKNATPAEKAAFDRNLSVCDTALVAAETIIANHEGFDKKGKVIDLVPATKSVKDLNTYILKHASALKNIRELTK